MVKSASGWKIIHCLSIISRWHKYDKWNKEINTQLYVKALNRWITKYSDNKNKYESKN